MNVSISSGLLGRNNNSNNNKKQIVLICLVQIVPSVEVKKQFLLSTCSDDVITFKQVF